MVFSATAQVLIPTPPCRHYAATMPPPCRHYAATMPQPCRHMPPLWRHQWRHYAATSCATSKKFQNHISLISVFEAVTLIISVNFVI
jgi:hypothetical protein